MNTERENTMKSKLFLIMLSVVMFASTAFGIEEREGFIKQLSTNDPNVITVPAGKEFVILQILTRHPGAAWDLKIDNVQFLNQDIFGYIFLVNTGGYGVAANFNVTFPDRCVTVKQGKTLSFEGVGATITIIGYLYDCNCPAIPLADLNKDCKVNMADLAILASQWLTDNTISS